MKHYAFFQNRECEFFPCHGDVEEAEFYCLFCYCPLYCLGERCGGAFVYLPNGVKSCGRCPFPHKRETYGAILARFPELRELAKKTERDDEL